MKKQNHITGFTLVEVLVAMTILAIVMVSILMIYALSAQVSLKTDINREMQQNIKSVIETIAEDVRKNNIKAVSANATNYVMPGIYNFGSALEIGDKNDAIGAGVFNRYYLVLKKDLELTPPPRASLSNCADIKNVCVLAKFDEGGNLIGPLSNSKISFTDLNFYVSNGDVPKVTIVFSTRVAANSGVRADIIKKSTLDLQTTISERNLQVK